MEIPGEDPSTLEIEGGVNGDEIVFFIGNQPADQTGTWASGADRELNLTTAQSPGWVIFLPLIFR